MLYAVCFGEVLWDIFPDGKKLGGAPLNVALRMNSCGVETNMISGVGNDVLGKEILDTIRKKGIDTQYIQINNNFDTGTVTVTLNTSGSASYEINHPVSWDKISINSSYIDLVTKSSAFIFGSLIARDEVSKKCLLELLDYATYSVFDVNLRPPHYNIEDLNLLMKRADFIKFNDEELIEIINMLGVEEATLEKQIMFIAKRTQTKSICVTLGEKGAVLYHNNKLYYQKGYPINVIDTVGAGDSFLGTLISNLLQKHSPDKALAKACAMGALVAQSKGANPLISEQKLLDYMQR